MRELIKARIVIPIVIAAAFTGNAAASEFWANKNGGGFDEALIFEMLEEDFTETSTVDQIEPVIEGSSLIYEVEVPTESTLTMEGLTDLSSIVLRDENGNVATIEQAQENQEDALEGSFKVGKGTWTVEVDREVNRVSSKPQSRINNTLSGIKNRNVSQSNDIDPMLIVDLSESLYSLATNMSKKTKLNGNKLYLSAFITDNITSENESEAIVGRVIKGSNTTAIARVTHPNGNKSRVKLWDNGASGKGDEQANDGVFSGAINLTVPGDYKIKYVFKTTIEGSPLKLTSLASNIVDDTRLRLLGNSVTATHGNLLDEQLEDGRYGFPIKVRLNKGSMDDIVRTRANVWAQNDNGDDVIVGWIGGLVEPQLKNGRVWYVPFTFHSGWLSQGNYRGGLKLKDIEISSLDNGDQILFSNKVIAIKGIEISNYSSRSATKLAFNPSDEMKQGVHPSLINGVKSSFNKRTRWQRDLLFLRGWCEGRAQATGHFSETIVNKALADPKPVAGASSEARAVQIMEFLGWTPGRLRGIVSHSQGGLVAATLLDDFSYVFADNAGSRPANVVTMGSPFNGSTLASQANGVWSNVLEKMISSMPDCYAPYELRMTSNSIWRNRIGSRARNQIVSFYTTHTKSRWYDPRNCNAGSYIISGHDDGVIAPREGKGFATGGEFLRSQSGYCHTNQLGQKDQWEFPEFVNYVNNLFNNDTEAWQPY